MVICHHRVSFSRRRCPLPLLLEGSGHSEVALGEAESQYRRLCTQLSCAVFFPKPLLFIVDLVGIKQRAGRELWDVVKGQEVITGLGSLRRAGWLSVPQLVPPLHSEELCNTTYSTHTHTSHCLEECTWASSPSNGASPE